MSSTANAQRPASIRNSSIRSLPSTVATPQSPLITAGGCRAPIASCWSPPRSTLQTSRLSCCPSGLV
jgi:hypothetical protein